MTGNGRCRLCQAKLGRTFADLGLTPLANSYVTIENLDKPEQFYPLCAYVCEKCFLVQLEQFESPEDIFSDYAYFSSYSDAWRKHCAEYAEMIIERFGYGRDSFVMEIASNDGYMLSNFHDRSIPCLGVEPASNVARAAMAKGIETVVRFFGERTAKELSDSGKKADLLIANNVLAHVPGLNDFVGGMKTILKSEGVVTVEFPHLFRLIRNNQFDTIYHEHFSYFSLITAKNVFARHGLTVFDVEQLPTHGGSLRLFICHERKRKTSEAVQTLLEREDEFGLTSPETYSAFSEQVKRAKRGLLKFLIEAKSEGKKIAGYGAPAKGNTLLNYCGIGTDFIDYTVDKSPHKQGTYLPGSRIAVHHPGKIMETKPDYLLILPWNIRDEIMEQMGDVRSWGGRFVIPIPEVKVYE